MTEQDDPRASDLDAVILLHDQLLTWFRELALPVWEAHGVDRLGGGYHEHLETSSKAPRPPGPGGVRRGRVVARQIYVFDVARRLGWAPSRFDPIGHGCDYLFTHLHQGEGIFHTAVDATNREATGAFSLYEQAFYLFVLARLMPSTGALRPIERTALQCLERLRRDLGKVEGGFEESQPPSIPLKSNPHMHLLEAALEWIEVSAADHRPVWVALATELVGLCLTQFIDAQGAVLEYFDSRWQPWSEFEGARHVWEPGHQFEWAWLFMQWMAVAECPPSQRQRCADAVTRFLALGERYGVDAERGVAINELWDDMSVKDPAAKLWPQTERVKAWCAMLPRATTPAQFEQASRQVVAAARGLARYVPNALGGLWYETLQLDDRFAAGPSKASSFYHITCALDVLRQTVSALGMSVMYSTPDFAASTGNTEPL
jgi:mannose/cellobiose epimerase-like protein (N-acyl-D-glucosamine 2-epimerase family)